MPAKSSDANVMAAPHPSLKAPLILACDTTQGACSVALYQGAVLASELKPMTKGHAEALMPMIETLLGQSGTDMKQIDRLAVTHGPGTFTGVRVGLAAMRGLALALGARLKTYGTLEVMAHAVLSETATEAPQTSPLLVAVDARRDTFYAQAFAADGTACGPPQALGLEACLTLTAARPLRVIGSGAALLAAADAALQPIDAPDWPQAQHLAELAAGDDDWENLLAAEPLYLRPPDATLPDPEKRIALAREMPDPHFEKPE